MNEDHTTEESHHLVARSEPRAKEAQPRLVDDVATLEVRLAAAERTPRSPYRVKHPKFGEGIVQREEQSSADTKLEIDFGQAGVRVLLSRFVERLP